jgi:hypothetical protein
VEEPKQPSSDGPDLDGQDSAKSQEIKGASGPVGAGENHYQISRAPPPITPLDGSGTASVDLVRKSAAKSANAARRPKWNKWRLIPEVRLWEAVALSLDIDPEKVRYNSKRWIDAQHRFSESDRFNERLEITRRNVGSGKSLTSRTLSLDEPTNCTVSLKQFTDWAHSIEWKIPAELAELRGGGSQTLNAPSAFEAAQRSSWGRKDLWTVRETAFLLCGRVPDVDAPNDEELNQARDEIMRAVRGGALQIVGEPTKAERLYDAQHLRPKDVIAWASERFSKFPLASQDLPASHQTAVTDYENGRILIQLMQEIARESARRRKANENPVADALELVRARVNELLAGNPLAMQDVSERLNKNALEQRSSQESGNSKQLAARSETAYLNAVGALLLLLLDKDSSGKPFFPSQASIISAIQSRFAGKHGLSERELEEKFAEAKRSLGSM